jgi:hypothetical protein
VNYRKTGKSDAAGAVTKESPDLPGNSSGTGAR